jgi:D-alanyl-D-alanine carboxypeptidase
MVTAMVALEQGEPSRMVLATVSSLVEPSVIGLDPGDRLPLREALYGLLLNSGNDVALAIAETIGEGSIQTFVDWMNGLARSMGLANTKFANPHGLDIGEHYSSAYDMAIIGRVMMRVPLLRSIVAEQRHDYQGPPLWAFRNINRFLYSYAGADGIKTGYETRAGRCLAASATRDGRQVIAVVLNSDDYVADSAALIDYGFRRLQEPVAVRMPSGPPAAGRVDRLLRLGSGGATLRGDERSRLRGAVKPDLSSLDRDPVMQSGSSSPFERLRSAVGAPARLAG